MSNHNHKPHDNPPQSAGREEGTFPDIQAYPRNWMVPVTLLILRECTSYGYQLMGSMVEFGFESINPGTLYRTLRRMEEDGHCSSVWQTDSEGPARRMYSITDSGEAYLEMWVRSLVQYQRNMDSFFEAYRSSGSRRSGSEEST